MPPNRFHNKADLHELRTSFDICDIMVIHRYRVGTDRHGTPHKLAAGRHNRSAAPGLLKVNWHEMKWCPSGRLYANYKPGKLQNGLDASYFAVSCERIG